MLQLNAINEPSNVSTTATFNVVSGAGSRNKQGSMAGFRHTHVSPQPTQISAATPMAAIHTEQVASTANTNLPYNSSIIKPDLAASFVLNNTESFETALKDLGYTGRYEIVVAFATEQSQKVIIILSKNFPQRAGKIATRLEWVTQSFHCTVYTPQKVLQLPYGPRPHDSSDTAQPEQSQQSQPVWEQAGLLPPAPVTSPQYAPEQDSASPAGRGESSNARTPAGLPGSGEGNGGPSDQHETPGSGSASGGSSVNRSDGDSSGKAGIEPTDSPETLEVMRRAWVTGHSFITSPPEESGTSIPLSLRFNFELEIEGCKTKTGKETKVPGRSWSLLEQWAKVEIKTFTIGGERPESQNSTTIGYYPQVFRITVSSTPKEAVPLPMSEAVPSQAKEVRTKNERSTAQKIALLAGLKPRVGFDNTRVNSTSVEVAHDKWTLSVFPIQDVPQNRVSGAYEYRQGCYTPPDRSYRVQDPLKTYFDYHDMRTTDPSIGRTIHVGIVATWSALSSPDHGKARPLHAEVKHSLDFEVKLSDIPVGRDAYIWAPHHDHPNLSLFKAGDTQTFASTSHMRNVNDERQVAFERSIVGVIPKPKRFSTVRAKFSKVLDKVRGGSRTE